MYEAVTGDTIENGVTRVAEEAGLTETALLPGDQNAMPDPSTHGYVDPAGAADLQQLAGVEVELGTDVTDWSLSWGGAGGGAYSTIADLFQWASTGSGNTLLSSELGDQRLPTEDGFIPDAGAFYGLGLLMQAPPWIGHSGQAIGWESYEVYDPNTGGTFAVLVNSTGGLAPVPRGLGVHLRTGVTMPSIHHLSYPAARPAQEHTMPSSTLCPTRRYRLALASLVAGIALALGIVTPAAAAVTGGLTLGSNTVTAGGSTTATATFNLATPAATVDVSLQIVAVGAVTGSATLSLDSTTVPTAAPCTVVSSAIGCAWDTPADGQSGTINATITTSADAVGTWELRANYVEDPGAGNVEQTLQSQTLTVTPAYTATFAAQSPSPAPPSSTLPSSVVFTLTGAADQHRCRPGRHRRRRHTEQLRHQHRRQLRRHLDARVPV